MTLASDWASHAAALFSSGGAAPHCAETEVRGMTEEDPATEPLLRAGESSHAPSIGQGIEERPGRALELVHGRSTVRHNLF